jgi:2-dehydropantoate 2-reductase
MTVGGDDVARAIIEETNSIARAAGYPIPDAQARQTTQILTAAGSFSSSMYRDLQQGSPVEVGTILGDLIAEGRKANLHTRCLKQPPSRCASTPPGSHDREAFSPKWRYQSS